MKIYFNKDQKRLLKKMDLPFDFKENLTKEQFCIIRNAVYDKSLDFVDKDDEIHGDGLILESIGDLIQDSMK